MVICVCYMIIFIQLPSTIIGIQLPSTIIFIQLPSTIIVSEFLKKNKKNSEVFPFKYNRLIEFNTKPYLILCRKITDIISETCNLLIL